MEYIADLPHWVPTTKLYRIGDQHVAISVIDFWDADGTEVYLCTEEGVAIDADGDPANGLTPLLRLPHGTSFEEAYSEAVKALEGKTDEP